MARRVVLRGGGIKIEKTQNKKREKEKKKN
jgi:hypothetical protein